MEREWNEWTVVKDLSPQILIYFQVKPVTAQHNTHPMCLTMVTSCVKSHTEVLEPAIQCTKEGSPRLWHSSPKCTIQPSHEQTAVRLKWRDFVQNASDLQSHI